jgi:ribosomal protein S18 acetylase RimI-like enzyme
MLLPESFQLGSPPEAFLAWDEEQQTITGAVAFHHLQHETIGLRVLTVRTYRRQGIASLLVQRVCERAGDRSDERVRTQLDLTKHPDAEPFLLANGFVTQSKVLRVEGLLGGAAGAVANMRTRLMASGKVPPDTRIAESRDLPPEIALRAYRELIAPNMPGRPELSEFIVTRPGFDSAILTVGGRLAGMIIGARNDGNGAGTLDAIAVAPGFRSGWGWANLLLLAYAADCSREAGANRLRFEIDERNWQVLQAIGRVEGTIIGRPAVFVREL